MLNKLKLYIKKLLGITQLENQVNRITKLENEVNRLERINYSLADKLDSNCRWLGEITQDNQLILRHIKMINSQFFVAADINNPKHAPSIVLILHRGKEEIVKSYTFDNGTVEQVHSMLEGFGKQNTRYDQPRGFPSPRWRY